MRGSWLALRYRQLSRDRNLDLSIQTWEWFYFVEQCPINEAMRPLPSDCRDEEWKYGHTKRLFKCGRIIFHLYVTH